jgi:hypothetical protein
MSLEAKFILRKHLFYGIFMGKFRCPLWPLKREPVLPKHLLQEKLPLPSGVR